MRHLPADDKSSLARASLVCRWIQQELAPKLYHTVTLDSPLKVEQMFSARTHDNAAVSPFLSLSQIHSLKLKLPSAQSNTPQEIDLSRLGPTRPASFPHSLHLVLGAPGDLYPALLSLLTPSHVTISRNLDPSFASSTGHLPPMFPQLGNTVSAAVTSWTMLRSIHLINTFPLASGHPHVARFIFLPIAFDEPLSITFSATLGLEAGQLHNLWMNFITRGVVRIPNLRKLEVRVRSAEDKWEVEMGKRSPTEFPVLDRAQVVLVENDNFEGGS
ncbi:hypothetical protein RQP46_001818 [Phenoliferia psychrophenolica]